MFQGNNGRAIGKAIRLNELNAAVFRAEHKHGTGKREISLRDTHRLMSQPIDPRLLIPVSSHRGNHLIRAERVWRLGQLGGVFVTAGLTYGLVIPNREEGKRLIIDICEVSRMSNVAV